MDRFLAVAAARGLELYPEQEEAILELFAGHNVVLNTPTGSGKSLVAAALHFKALCAGERSVYTCPIKALVNEKFLSLCRDFGPEHVGMMTGDASVNPRARILCCTAEILANIALQRGATSDVRAVIMDEFHYYSDAERGYAWQVPLLTMPGTRFLLMSATLGATEFFEKEMTRVTGAPSVTVRSDRRPVPLEFEYSETPLTERIAALLEAKRAPVYLVYFTQRSASEAAQSMMSLNVCSKEEKATLQAALEGVRFNSPYGKEVRRWLRHGIGVHHAGLLPKYRILVEQLAQKGLLKLICGTDTLGVGINVPIRTVVFTQLWKYDGKKAAVLTVRDFRQVAGRAGRKGYDDKGYVIAQAPEYMIENKRAEEKAAGDPKKQKKLVKQRAPEGSVGWDIKTFERLQTAPSEGLVSRFDISHGMLLLVLSRESDGCRAMRQLITDCHETPHKKRALRTRAWQLFRALLDRQIVEFLPRSGERQQADPSGLPRSGERQQADPSGLPRSGEPQQADPSGLPRSSERQQADPSGLPRSGERQQADANVRKLRVNLELQDDFSLHQALSLYLIDTLPLLTSGAGRPPRIAEASSESLHDSASTGQETSPENRPETRAPNPDYPFDVLTLCESIVEDPDQILRRQIDKLKGEKIMELKEAGVPYEERMEKLEAIEHPKPLREFLYETFNAFAAAHPWINQENVRPKSIAREMFERYRSFSDYVKDYGLERSEGLLLRHLSQVWKVLSQTVPESAKTDEVVEMEDYFRELIRGIDSSLLEEWERLKNPDFIPAATSDADQPARPASFDITRDAPTFRRLVRTAIFGFLQDVAAREFDSALSRLRTGEAAAPADNDPISPDARKLEAAFAAYFDARTRFRLDPEGRSAKHTHWSEDNAAPTADGGKQWLVAQVLIDAEEQNDWEATFTISLAESRAQNRAVVSFSGVGPIGTQPAGETANPS